MAHFYGIIKGDRGSASRCGSARSGLTTTSASYQGAVKVRLFEGADGKDYAHIELVPWCGEGVTQTIYCGPVGEAMTGTWPKEAA